MKLFYALSMLAFASLPLAYPVAVQSNVVTPFVGSSAATNTSAVTDASAGASTSIDVATENDPDTVIDSVKMDATSNNANTKASSKTPTAAQVKTAAANFAKDANTVSGNINSLGSASSASQIKSMASAAFKAESDEDAQRSVLAAAAGSAGSKSNSLIVKNTPIVLTGLKNIMNNPTAATTKSNLKTIQNARNPNILPSIMQLSNSAMQAVGLPQTAQKFTATTG